jgi:hypothetical protein
MLTSSTVRILNDLAAKSDALYSQGGLLYKYSFGHRCAHTDLSNVIDISTSIDVEKLELFIASAIDNPFPESAGNDVKHECSKLLSALANDFSGFLGPKFSIEEDDTSKIVTLIYTASNDYHTLRLFWSID